MRANKVLNLLGRELVVLFISLLCAFIFGYISIDAALKSGGLEKLIEPTYLVAFDNIINDGIDIYRTPLYPLFLGGIRWGCFNCQWWPLLAVVFQNLLFLYSIHLYYKLLNTYCPSRYSFWCTLLYGCLPGFVYYNSQLFTESISVSLIVCFVYSFIMLDQKKERRYIWLTLVLCLFLIMLRPSFIYIPFGLILYATFNVFHKRRNGKHLLLGSIVVLGIMLNYTYRVYKQTNVFSPTVISIANQYDIARMYGFLDPSVIKDNDFYHDVDSLFHLSDGRNRHHINEHQLLSSKYGYDTLNNFIQESYKKYPAKRIEAIVRNLYNASTYTLFEYYTTSLLGYALLSSGVAIGWVLIGVIFLCFCAVNNKIARNSQFSWIFPILLFICSHIIVTIIGAQDEYPRLILPIYSLILLIVSCLVLNRFISPLSPINKNI